ncbi:MAG: hypothetical protein QM831_26765 [Kofleriaceae bacterium]
MRSVLVAVLMVLAASPAHAQYYTKSAGQNAPAAPAPVTTYDKDGRAHTEMHMVTVPADSFGNAQGNQHDLAVDGAFKGETVAVIQEYTGEGFDFSLPKKALEEKGFSTFRWSNGVPTPEDLEAALKKSSQLWLISGSSAMLTKKHIAVIKKYFDEGHGVYIWGDNEPYYADANLVAQALLGSDMTGNVMGDQVVGVEAKVGGVGLLPNHLLTTGLQHIYEGITIATIHPTKDMQPLIYGSAGNLVAAVYDKDGKRAILDGGFTRLFLKWDTAGTARYVKNSAAWLANVERFHSDDAKKPELVKSVPAEEPPPGPLCPTGVSAMMAKQDAANVPADDGVPTVWIALGLLGVIAGFAFAWVRISRSSSTR